MELEPDLWEDDYHSFGGVWTRIKLEALDKYLSAFNRALSGQNFKRLYIDAFAGTGRCDITVDGEKTCIDGSARRALRAVPPFHAFYFIELKSKKLGALRALRDEYPGLDIEIVAGDANSAIQQLCRTYDWRNTRAVLFLDPYGMHVEWATLEAVARTGAIDVWYLFPYSGLYRQAAKAADAIDPSKAAAITKILGTDGWRQTFYAQPRQNDLFGMDTADERAVEHPEMLAYVSARLRTVFPAVTEPKILYQSGNTKNPAGAPLFALYFAASNPSPKAYGLATKIARDVLNGL
ncbi:MAG: three-Cys-motif partner protein TcmP [Desulforhabdus sp.]|jgi:three-Cys-motif partner protein|nr:three-Cys-motif partner protein TcmP [Desulforhabdus sp.]